MARVQRRRPDLSRFVQDRLQECEDAYVGASQAADTSMADPLLVLESAARPVRPLPPFFAICGTRDPILDDTRRLGAALKALEVEHQTLLYPGELHAFHAFLWRKAAQQAWADTFVFLDRMGLPSARVS